MTKRAILISVLLSLALCLPLSAQQATSAAPSAMTLEDTLALVATYQVGESRAALVELGKRVVAVSASPEKAKAMEQALLRTLEGKGTLEGKDQICRHLMLIGSAASVPTLARMLVSAETADMARFALERIPGTQVDQALLATLQKSTGKVQIGIVNSLGRRRSASALATLRGLVTANDPAVAAAAASALGQIADPAAAAALAAVRPKASGALRNEIDEAYLRCAEQMAGRGDNKGALTIFKELSAASEPEAIRFGALRGVALSGGAEAAPILSAALMASEPRVQAQAIRQLSAVPGAEVTMALGRALPGMDTLGKMRIVAALADRGDKAALPVLLNATQDSAQPVRVAALQALGKIGDGSVVVLLAETAAADANAAASAGAADGAAARTGGLRGPGAAVTEPGAARESLYGLRGADVDKAIITAISTAKPNVRVELIKATSERNMAAATGVLLKTAMGGDRETRRAALVALRGTARPPDVPALIDLLTKVQSADRPDAVRALSSALRRSETVSLNPVTTAYQSASEPEIRGSLLTVLAQVGRDESLPVLRGALKDTNPEIRRGAIQALAEWPTTAPASDLLENAKSDANGTLQVLSLRGYIRLVALPETRTPAETLRMLTAAMNAAKRADEKKAVLSLLSRINSKEALALAEDAAKDPEIASEAKMAADQIRQRLAPARKKQ